MEKTLSIKTAVIITAICTAFASAGAGYAVHKYYNNKMNSIFEILIENERHYREVKDELISEVDGCIKTVAPQSGLSSVYLVELAEEYNIDIVFILAQGLKESHFGTRGCARITNSVWNVGAFDDTAVDKMTHYDSPDKSIEPYLDILTKKYISKGGTSALLENFVDIHGHRYASSETYEKDLQKIYNDILRSTKIDSLQIECNVWRNKSDI